MEWRDEGLLLSVRRHGENGAVIEVLTAQHGRHAGLVHGGAGVRLAAVLQPGAQLALEWRARLEDHLGTYRVEPLASRAAAIMADRGRLAALNAVSAMLLATVPERAPDADLYAVTVALADRLAEGEPTWPIAYARWELALLGALGYGLDLSRCAATGTRAELAFVSPRTGRAVSRGAGAAWADRLLPLPGFLIGRGQATIGAVREALRLTGHFLESRALPELGRETAPEARARLLSVLERTTMPPPAPDEPPRDDEAEYHRAMGPVRTLLIPGS